MWSLAFTQWWLSETDAGLPHARSPAEGVYLCVSLRQGSGEWMLTWHPIGSGAKLGIPWALRLGNPMHVHQRGPKGLCSWELPSSVPTSTWRALPPPPFRKHWLLQMAGSSAYPALLFLLLLSCPPTYSKEHTQWDSVTHPSATFPPRHSPVSSPRPAFSSLWTQVSTADLLIPGNPIPSHQRKISYELIFLLLNQLCRSHIPMALKLGSRHSLKILTCLKADFVFTRL